MILDFPSFIHLNCKSRYGDFAVDSAWFVWPSIYLVAININYTELTQQFRVTQL